MRKTVIKKYPFNLDKLKGKHISISLISDIHFSKITNYKTLNKLINDINKESPDYICIAGDIVDSLNIIYDDVCLNNLCNWFRKLVKENKSTHILASLGNHDLSSIDDEYEMKLALRKLKRSISNTGVVVLDNDIYEDDFVCIAGFTQPKMSFFDNNSLKIEKDYYNAIDDKLISPNKNKLTIALIHSPINIVNNEIKNKLSCYDFILSGHMHNGLIPPLIDKIVKNNCGLIQPNKKLFPKIARGCVKLNKDKYLIISGGITKLSKSSKAFHYFNFIWPMNIENIVIN